MTKTNAKRVFAPDVFAALALLCVFAGMILLTLVIGAGIYRQTSKVSSERYNSRTAASYITSRIRAADRAGAVSVSETDGSDTLVLSEYIDGDRYVTRIWCKDGMLVELYLKENYTDAENAAVYLSSAANDIIEASSLDLGFEGDLLTVRLTGADGSVADVVVALRSEVPT